MYSWFKFLPFSPGSSALKARFKVAMFHDYNKHTCTILFALYFFHLFQNTIQESIFFFQTEMQWLVCITHSTWPSLGKNFLGTLAFWRCLNRSFPSCVFASMSKRGFVGNHSYENVFSLHIKLVFIPNVLNEELYWNRGTRELKNGLLWSSIFQLPIIPSVCPQISNKLLMWNTLERSAYSQEHFTTIVYTKFGEQSEGIMGNWKIKNVIDCISWKNSAFVNCNSWVSFISAKLIRSPVNSAIYAVTNPPWKKRWRLEHLLPP